MRNIWIFICIHTIQYASLLLDLPWSTFHFSTDSWCNVKCPSLKKGRWPIHKDTFETFYLINNVEDNFVFSRLKKCFISEISGRRNAQVEKSQVTKISFQNYKHGYPIQKWSDKAFKETVVNLTCRHHGGSLEIDPLMLILTDNINEWYHLI